jgi:hypothetical protein
MRDYHPLCQNQKLVCNKCFINNYFNPLDSKFLSVFGQCRKINTYFYSSLKFFNLDNVKKNQFFVINFDVNDY